MNMNTKRVLFWTPRVLGILFAVYLSVSALVYAFSEEYGVGEIILALLSGLVSIFLFVTVLVIAWRSEMIGAIIFIAIALFSIVAGESWVISAILFLIGGFFLLGWIYEERSLQKYKEMK